MIIWLGNNIQVRILTSTADRSGEGALGRASCRVAFSESETGGVESFRVTWTSLLYGPSRSTISGFGLSASTTLAEPLDMRAPSFDTVRLGSGAVAVSGC